MSKTLRQRVFEDTGYDMLSPTSIARDRRAPGAIRGLAQSEEHPGRKAAYENVQQVSFGGNTVCISRTLMSTARHPNSGFRKDKVVTVSRCGPIETYSEVDRNTGKVTTTTYIKTTA